MSRRLRRRRAAFTLVEFLVVVAVIGLVIALLLPSVRTSREAARRNQCLNNTKQISLGLLNYNSAKNEFPPAYTTDTDGKPLHSWRTLLIPFLETIDLRLPTGNLDKRWDDPANSKLLNAGWPFPQCPSVADLGNRTTYLAIVTPTSFIQPTLPRKLADVKDGQAGTIVFMDANEKHAVPWMAPVDADESLALGICDPEWPGQHGNLTTVSFADGHGKSIFAGISPDVMRAIISIAGNENLEKLE
jgi:prepilin-type N-terminal cleavage/methylation domain-containing protein/prepilin-type processing-associated H-X9-DG protein